MLTENRRKFLKERSSLDKRTKTEYDYRILKWLQAMLDPGPEGGIGDINRVLDTLDREAIHKYLKDENVDDLLKLVERLIEILDFVPIKNDPETGPYVSKSIIVAPKEGGEVKILGIARAATAVDFSRRDMLDGHKTYIESFIKAGISRPDPRSAEYFKGLIDDAHKQGLIVPQYDFPQPSKEENLLSAIERARGLGDPVPPEEQIAELKEKVAKQRSENKEEPK
jgi:hypothetical protein